MMTRETGFGPAALRALGVHVPEGERGTTSAEWVKVRYRLRLGHAGPVEVTFPELAAAVGALAPASADAVRLLAPGESHAEPGWRVVRLGGAS